MRNKIKKLINATNVIDKTYVVKGRSMAVKPNIVVLFYAIANSENLSQSQLRDEWMLPLSWRLTGGETENLCFRLL